MSYTKEVKGWVPFTLYDFFGYLFPGIILIGGILLYLITPITGSQFYQSLKTIYKDFTGLFSGLSILFGLVSVYITGHFIATISHITLDRIIVGTILKYPYITLLKLQDKDRKIAWPIHKLILVLLFTIWVISIVSLFIPSLKIVVVIGIYIFACLIGIRLFLVLIKGAFPSIVEWQANSDSRWYKLLIGWHSWLIEALLINPIRQLLAIDKGFTFEFATQIRKKIENRFKIDCNCIESENFWLPCLEILKNPEYSRMTNNWLHLYSLNRNVCMSFVLLSAFSILNHFLFHFTNGTSEKFVMIASITCAAIFGGRYIMLYYTYYSKNVFRFFYVEETDETVDQIYN